MSEIVALTEALAERIERMEPVERASRRLATTIKETHENLNANDLGRCLQLLALAVQARRVQGGGPAAPGYEKTK